LKKALLAAIAFAAGWIWGFLSIRALLERSRNSLRPSALVKKAADRRDSMADRLDYAIERGRERARMREIELRRRFGLEP
jgi:hypothetical protein